MSFRKLQIAELLRRNISIVLQADGHYIYGPEAMVTVTSVNVTPDLALAKVYLSIFNSENKQAVLLELEAAIHEVKKNLYNRIRKHVRRVPDIVFYLDDTLDEIHKVDEMMRKLREDNQMGSDEEE
ncbi:MAG: 30S ribosome-binding factor RbfA [Saprospiraceae bacterium]|jgi:ribosome-binding factor A|uniref:30S ribosome-binding factor RbfA n=1 Tax=Candidatus Brachybacter algidus TaxID=2982024 RepID=UPI001B73D93A|nr:30S ribosome-binding factor RbfA [Candidatus Brachybacter algidus]MBP7540389.1 30S ribosome-binding factor RbfA [Saprospiraceae bacterium]MBK6373162.1 30S ribosome-binding factor RbfA [Candidatus Brachybacter algidus]MBK6447814.1 30S ribosome-binding factor RbfA [Candidatus Brachybacter algidus]MBK7602625.1 30S ribosome-binding factor RbfA [Candidatus Brachybacter algidus]MBK8354715.1 30S ribosome-binding factor RbfA [Candidatus Brachybacter algidus]